MLSKVIRGPVFAEVSMKNKPFLGHGRAECQPVALQGIGRLLSCMLGSMLVPADQNACVENRKMEPANQPIWISIFFEPCIPMCAYISVEARNHSSPSLDCKRSFPTNRPTIQPEPGTVANDKITARTRWGDITFTWEENPSQKQAFGWFVWG